MTSTTNASFSDADLSHAIGDIIEGLFEPPLALHEPVLGDSSLTRLHECVKSGWVSTAGPFVGQFEDVLAAYTGAKHVIATSSGTAALHICLKIAGVRIGDEVLIPSLSFVATANAVAYCGAIPHFVDIDAATLGMNPTLLADRLKSIVELRDGAAWNRETGRRISALVPMHTFGHPVDTRSLAKLADHYRLVLIEDAAESLGSLLDGQHTGTMGQLAALSFNGNKIVTTGGGGAILTNDPKLAQRARHLTTTAKIAHPWKLAHDEVGYNYRLPNLNAALGLAQMEQLEWSLERKRTLREVYDHAFSNLSAGTILKERSGVRCNYWLHGYLLNREFSGALEAIIGECHRRNIFVRPAWTPLHELPMFCNAPRTELPVTEDLCGRLLCLPSGAGVLSRRRHKD